jgi:hypothetical protein
MLQALLDAVSIEQAAAGPAGEGCPPEDPAAGSPEAPEPHGPATPFPGEGQP